MKKALLYISVLFTVILLIIYSKDVITYSKEAMELCYSFIIPTLFPFFVCSGLLVYSGFGSLTAKYAGGIMRPLFNVAPAGSAALILGITGGFPLGAITAVQLYKCGALSKSETERLLSFCNNSGPLFVIGTIGVAVYGKLSYGVALYIIHIISSLLTGFAFRSYHADKHHSPDMRLDTDDIPLSQAFSTALSNASKNIVTVCLSIIFFAAVSRTIIGILNLPPLINSLATGLCEFSTGTLKISMLDIELYKKLIMTSLIIGFAGISVHIQVMAVTADAGLSLKPYIGGKALQAVISAALTGIALYLFPISAQVFSPCKAPLSASFTFSAIALIGGLAAFSVFAIIAVLKIRAKNNTKTRRLHS